MANRAKPKTAKKKAAKGRVVSRGTVATLPKRKSKKRGIGDSSDFHAVPDEVIERNLVAVKAKKKALDKIVADYKEDLDQARGVYRSARKLAKKEGVNLKAFDILVALESDDLGHVQVNYADVARYQQLTDSPLLQLDMFKGMLAPPAAKVDANLQGQHAGKNAEPAENNPFTAGSEDFQSWAEGWATGQQMNMDKFKDKGATLQ